MDEGSAILQRKVLLLTRRYEISGFSMYLSLYMLQCRTESKPQNSSSICINTIGLLDVTKPQAPHKLTMTQSHLNGRGQ
jgi:hypothetical protein